MNTKIKYVIYAGVIIALVTVMIVGSIPSEYYNSTSNQNEERNYSNELRIPSANTIDNTNSCCITEEDDQVYYQSSCCAPDYDYTPSYSNSPRGGCCG